MKRPLVRRIRRSVAAATIVLALAGCGDSPETLLAKANESIARDEPRSAEIHLKNLLQQQDSGQARYLLGTVLLRNNDLRGAEKEFRRALEAGYDRAKVAPELSSVMLKLGSFEALVNEFSAPAALPGEPAAKARVLTALGRAQLALGKRDAGKASFEAALAAHAGYAPARVALIALRAGAGDTAGADAELDEVLAKHPGSLEALMLKGDLALGQRHERQAREYYAKAAAADRSDHESRRRLAAVSLSLKDYDGAQKAVDELRKITGPAAATLTLQAQIHFAQDKREQARDAVLAALKVAPEYVPALLLSAQVHLALNSLQLAEQHARRATELAPGLTAGYRLLAATYVRMNAPDKAMQLLSPILERHATKDGALYAIAGEAALRANEPAKASAWYRQASKLDPGDARMATGLALASLSRGEKERGVAELEHASEMDAGSARADYALVMTHLRERRYDKALAAVDALEKKLPGSALAANLRGAVFVARGDATAARGHFEEALRRDPKFFPATANLAQLDLRAGKADDAKKRYAGLLEKDPKNVQAMIALAQIAQAGADMARVQKAREDALAGRIPEPDAAADPRGSKEAFDWLKKARETDRASVPAALALTAWYVLNGQPKEAIPMLQEMLAASKDDIRLLDALGTTYLRAEQPAQAMEAFEKVAKLRPDAPTIQLQMGRVKASLNDLDGAVIHLRKAAALMPNALEPRTALAQVLFRQGKVAEARQVAITLQKDHPKSGAGAAMEGDISMAERKFADAVTAYRKSLAVEKTPPVQLKLHRALVAAGNSSEADTMLRTMLAAHPDDPGLRSYAGERAVAGRHWAEAIGHYQAVLAKQPQNAVAMNNLAWAMHQTGDPKALEFAEKAYLAAPKSPAVLDTLGVILVARGDAARAVPLLRQAIAASPKAPELRLHLAEALLKTGDRTAARSELETVLRDAPSGRVAEAAQALQKQL